MLHAGARCWNFDVPPKTDSNETWQDDSLEQEPFCTVIPRLGEAMSNAHTVLEEGRRKADHEATDMMK